MAQSSDIEARMNMLCTEQGSVGGSAFSRRRGGAAMDDRKRSPPTYTEVSRSRVGGRAAGVRGMDAEPEAYRDVFTASAAQSPTRLRRIEATQEQFATTFRIETAQVFWYAVIPSEGASATAGSGHSGGLP